MMFLFLGLPEVPHQELHPDHGLCRNHFKVPLPYIATPSFPLPFLLLLSPTGARTTRKAPPPDRRTRQRTPPGLHTLAGWRMITVSRSLRRFLDADSVVQNSVREEGFALPKIIVVTATPCRSGSVP